MPVFNENKHARADHDRLLSILETIFSGGYHDDDSLSQASYVIAESKTQGYSISDCIFRLNVVLNHVFL